MKEKFSKKDLEKLKEDKHYYGAHGKKFLSNSDISTLLTNPLALGESMKPIPPFLIGSYFHTAILEPEKLKNFKVIDATTRNTKVYKEASGGELCLLKSEKEATDILVETMMSNDFCRSMIRGKNVEYEVPGIAEIYGKLWKGKADIINHDEKLIIDLKTTADITKFKYSATKYNYNSQAYIYQELFGYELVFMVIDKITKQIGVYDCSSKFLSFGEEKVKSAVVAHKLFFNNPNFKAENYFINQTL